MKPIGIFDSGYGGLTVFKSIVHLLPQYDYIYLGDNARAPYGNRSFQTVYEYTLQCAEWLFKQDCPLIIVACNTASAKALRSIQELFLSTNEHSKKILGVIRPTAEVVGSYSKAKNIGILGTAGTVRSESYVKEINHFFPEVNVYQQACPLWVPFIENGDHLTDSMDVFIQRDLKSLFQKNNEIDTILLACTHYPLIENKIKKYLPKGVTLISQGEIVAKSLADYLLRHPEIIISEEGKKQFYTTDSETEFENQASLLLNERINARHVKLL